MSSPVSLLQRLFCQYPSLLGKNSRRQSYYRKGCAARRHAGHGWALSAFPGCRRARRRLCCHLLGRHITELRVPSVPSPELSLLAGAEGEEEGANTDFWRHWFENSPTYVNDYESGLLGPLIFPVNNSLRGFGHVSSPLCFPSVDQRWMASFRENIPGLPWRSDITLIV